MAPSLPSTSAVIDPDTYQDSGGSTRTSCHIKGATRRRSWTSSPLARLFLPLESIETRGAQPTKHSFDMGLLQEEFEEYAEKAKTLPGTTTNESKLLLYGLFKQATVGPVNTARPGFFDMTGKAKWDAWKAVEAKSKEEAMTDYITKVKQLLEEASAASTSS